MSIVISMDYLRKSETHRSRQALVVRKQPEGDQPNCYQVILGGAKLVDFRRDTLPRNIESTGRGVPEGDGSSNETTSRDTAENGLHLSESLHGHLSGSASSSLEPSQSRRRKYENAYT